MSKEMQSQWYEIDSKNLCVTQRKLCESLTVTETVKRGFLVKRDVPYVIKNVVALS